MILTDFFYNGFLAGLESYHCIGCDADNALQHHSQYGVKNVIQQGKKHRVPPASAFIVIEVFNAYFIIA